MATHDELVLAQPSLWGFWKLDTTSPLVDSSGLSRPSFVLTGGEVGDVLINGETPSTRFDGVDDHAVLSTNGLANPTNWGISMVISPRADWSTYAPSFSPGLWTHTFNSSGLPMVLAINATASAAGQLQCGFYNGAWRVCTTTYKFAVGKRYHIFGSWDGTTIRLYVNGLLRASFVPGSVPTGNTANEIRLARRWDSAQYIAADISRVDVFTGAPSQSAVQDLAISALRLPQLPAAPTVTAYGLNGSVHVKWNELDNVSQYAVIVDGGTPIYYDISNLSATIGGLTNGATTTVEVHGVNDTGSGPVGTASATVGSAIHFDTFDRPNSTSAPGTPQHGGPYTVRIGTWGINENALYTSASNADAMITFPGAIDFDAILKIRVAGGNGGLLFRWIDALNTWLFQWTATGLYLHRRTAGTWQQQGGGWVKPPVAGDTYRMRAVGRSILVYRDEVLVLAVDDQYLAQATSTLGFRFASDTTTRLDEVIVQPGSLPANPPGDMVLIENLATDPPYDQGLLYKGRDTKLADQGAVA